MSLDLRSTLPELLPRAIGWAEMQSQHVAELGQALNSTGIALAHSVGVKYPERIRVKLVDTLPLPIDPLLLQAALETGLLVREWSALRSVTAYLSYPGTTPGVCLHTNVATFTNTNC